MSRAVWDVPLPSVLSPRDFASILSFSRDKVVDVRTHKRDNNVPYIHNNVPIEQASEC